MVPVKWLLLTNQSALFQLAFCLWMASARAGHDSSSRVYLLRQVLFVSSYFLTCFACAELYFKEIFGRRSQRLATSIELFCRRRRSLGTSIGLFSRRRWRLFITGPSVKLLWLWQTQKLWCACTYDNIRYVWLLGDTQELIDTSVGGCWSLSLLLKVKPHSDAPWSQLRLCWLMQWEIALIKIRNFKIC